MKKEKTPLVSIKCFVYNHEPYLRQCLDGFVMQKTDFPFEAIVHDDASTDNSAAIIREYAEKYPDIIKPIYETENQYSKKDGSLSRIMNQACRGKYIAICEGDDYWIDPLKLQKQVSFLETHPDYTMCVTEAKVLAPDNSYWEWQTYKEDCEMPTSTIISRGMHFIQTCTYVYRYSVYDDWPTVNNQCCVGDFPLFITCALKGKVYYLSCRTGVYRKCYNNDSWNSRINKYSIEQRIALEKNIADTFLGLNDYSHGKYRLDFYYAVAHLVYNLVNKYPQHAKLIINSILPVPNRKEVLLTLNKSQLLNLWLWRYRLNAIFKVKHFLARNHYKLKSNLSCM